MAATSEPVEPEFHKYFASISKKCDRWWNFYTLTDTFDRQSQDKAGFSSFDSPFDSPFDFGLMVKKVVPKRSQNLGIEDKKKVCDRVPVLEGICKYLAESNHVLLIGKPGSGKSTALTRLLLEKCRDAIHRVFYTPGEIHPISQSGELPQIPVLIELRYWQNSVFQLIEAFFNQHELPLTENEIKSLLSQRKLLLLVDGLNELPSEEARRQVAAFRRGEFSQTPMIFTTRDLGIGGDLGIKKKLEMLPLTESQMRQFVLAYLPEQGEELLRQLRDRVREFGQTPLLLWMLCELFRQQNSIPANLGMVFRLFTQGYENRVKQDVPIKSDRNWWKPLLEHLAFVMMQGKPATEFRVTIPKQEVKMVFQKFLQEKVAYADDFALRCLDDLLNHHLIEVGSGEQIQFRHQLLQEYYAAESLLRLLPELSDRKLQRDYLNLLKWTESIAIALGLVEDEAQAVHIVKLALDVDLMLGARLAGEVKQKFQEKTVRLVLGIEVPELIKVEFLGITKSEFTVNYLNNCLQSENSDVRIRAVNILVQIGNEAAVDILSTLLDDEEYYISFQAIRELVKIGNETAVNALISALKSVHPNVRKRAAIGLGKIGNEAAVHPLIATLNDEDSGVRFSATNALDNIGNEDAVNALNDSPLYKFSKKIASAPQVVEDEDEELEVELESNKILANNVDYQVKIEYLIPLLNHPTSSVCIGATEFLIKICDKTTVHLLMTALQDENSEVRWRVAEVLAQIGTEASPTINSLITALQDENSEVRWRVAEALGNIGNETAVNPLITALQDENSEVRWRVAEALGNIGNEAAVNPLITALQDEHSLVRWTVAEALVKIATYDILYQMWKFLLSGVYEAKDIILKIQENYKFYNHEIFDSPPVEDETENKSQSTTTNNFYAPVGIVNTGKVDIHGNQIGLQDGKSIQ
ncbi:HEAT repeat domain-containing protein [Brunnivagina elsteri]|uniref:NACHT domain-containing protein n=1 Tax=Brunnivagina elsteri CCALA 953 TaxID=987040 RepID=A0A2A2TQB5_9CYAN|nr:HEAT repeat domain-containing protein [Calothrix elsteri]PAX60640.1 hypothetical protein CK510_00870 [Calothrix elsteri CCALA 953]